MMGQIYLGFKFKLVCQILFIWDELFLVSCEFWNRWFFLWCLCTRVVHVLTKQKNTFLCVAYGQYQKKKILNIFFIKKQIFEVLKMYFRMDFLNTKNYFLAFWILQHVCKTPKGVGQYSKNIKILFLENSSLFTINIWIKKSQSD